MISSVAPVIAVLVVAALAVFSAERRIVWLHVSVEAADHGAAVPDRRLAGDAARLVDRRRASRCRSWATSRCSARAKGRSWSGWRAFLLAHLAYVVAFVGVAVWSPHVAIVAVATVAATAFVLRAIRPGTAGLRGPTIAYGVVISAMVIAASATLGGPLAAAPLAAGGATFFYASDASLALNRFRRPIPHAAFFTLGLYWIGQIGIALAARGGH